MTVTSARIEANRRNAQKSTGPRTAAGKEASKFNALFHGMHANELVLPDESKELFHEFRKAYLLRLLPMDVVELTLVERIVVAAWRLRRVPTMERLLFQWQGLRVPESLREPNPQRQGALARSDVTLFQQFICDPKAVENLQRYEQKLENSIHKSLRELARMRKETGTEKRSRRDCVFLEDEPHQTDESIERNEATVNLGEEKSASNVEKDAKNAGNDKLETNEPTMRENGALRSADRGHD
jgi:hypothetical protein